MRSSVLAGAVADAAEDEDASLAEADAVLADDVLCPTTGPAMAAARTIAAMAGGTERFTRLFIMICFRCRAAGEREPAGRMDRGQDSCPSTACVAAM